MKKYVARAGVLFLLFVAFTVLVALVDVRSIGPLGTEVGLAGINGWVFERIGVHLLWYHVTDWLGVVAILFAFGFAVTGLVQLIRRRSIRRVDRSLIVLGGFYGLVIGCYLFFEQVVINYRPVLLGEHPEASYPSSHTMIVICIMATAAMELRRLCPGKKRLWAGMDVFSAVLIAVTVVGRLLSGVHWLSDIVGGLLLSAALVLLYDAVTRCVEGDGKLR